MASTTMVFGLMFMLLGLGGYFLTGRQSSTALIPVIPGVIFLALGAMARNDRLRKHAMHAAAALSLIAFLAMIRAMISLAKWAGGTEPERPAAIVSQSILGLLMLVFLVLCVRSFKAARRARVAGGAAAQGTTVP